jgi:hypothetical protein
MKRKRSSQNARLAEYATRLKQSQSGGEKEYRHALVSPDLKLEKL